jgi:hypothetical protein
MSSERKRDYGKEYRDYHARPAQKKRRAMRNAARTLMISKGRVKKGDGKDVDHKNRNPMDNSSKNLRVQSQKKNRGWRRDK